MLLASKQHTAGDTRRWEINYGDWLANTAVITDVSINSSSTTCTVMPAPTILGKDVVFFLTGGNVGENVTLSVEMQDSFENVKNDTIVFTVVAP